MKPVDDSSRQPRSPRDPRIDLLRGFALIMIFIDHVPADPLRAGLADEISVAIFPAVDGAQGAPSISNSTNADAWTGRCRW